MKPATAQKLRQIILREKYCKTLSSGERGFRRRRERKWTSTGMDRTSRINSYGEEGVTSCGVTTSQVSKNDE